jgi:hypothetical protein
MTEMIIMAVRGSPVLVAASLLFVSVTAAPAQDAPGPLSPVEALESKIELGLHERLIRARKKEGATLAPFASDGCSGGLSAGWAMVSSTFPAIAKSHGDRPPWESCCIAHDRRYHTGGAPDADAKASFESRRLADEELRQCVIAVGETQRETLSTEYNLTQDDVSRLYQTTAGAMYWAVRLGGAPCTGLSWRWGFGWPACD